MTMQATLPVVEQLAELLEVATAHASGDVSRHGAEGAATGATRQ